jgi:two-component system NtrC family sensor kinase
MGSFIILGVIALSLAWAGARFLKQLRSCKSTADILQKKVLSTEERYRSLFDQASEGIVIADADDLRILEVNQTARRLLGVPGPDSGFLPSFCRIHPDPDPRPRTGPEWFAAICRHRNVTLMRRDGGTTPAEADGAPIQFEGRPAYQFFMRELSDRARLEQQLRQSEKLSALGQMISGVAHELNNPLAVIKGYMELMLRRDPLSPQMRTDLEKVALESTRAAKLVSNFLSFAREQPMHRERVDLNELVRALLASRQADFNEARASLVFNPDAGALQTEGDPDQIRQALVNVLNNALQAVAGLPGGGRVQVSTSAKADLIQIRVEDNGPGVPPEVLPHIFEPFFTTREVGQGTGLGLSIAHSILSDHNGRILHQPAAGGGACFVLELPVIAAAAAETAAPAPAPGPDLQAAPGRARARILILDDDPTIAELLGEMVGLLGYTSSVCHSGAQALDLIGRQEFDLIISDFRMPKMNGQEFYQQAVRRKPELAPRILFLTGDVVNDDTQAFLKSTGNPHLAKPFQLACVERTLADVLQRNLAAR